MYVNVGPSRRQPLVVVLLLEGVEAWERDTIHVVFAPGLMGGPS